MTITKMAKERLSRLQKWILVEAYKKGKERESKFWETTLDTESVFWLSKRHVYLEYFCVGNRKDVPLRNIIVLSWNINKLKKKKYILYHSVSGQIILTENGVLKAKDLLNVNKKDHRQKC